MSLHSQKFTRQAVKEKLCNGALHYYQFVVGTIKIIKLVKTDETLKCKNFHILHKNEFTNRMTLSTTIQGNVKTQNC